MIGLALSGGGSRAIAFHLGCLRALHDLGVLSRISVLSSISGGSVIGAYYAYSPTLSFGDFEDGVRAMLRRGFQHRLAAEVLTPLNLFRGLGNSVAFVADGLSARVLRREPTVRRYPSRTDLFQKVLERDVFPGLRMSSLRRHGLRVVIGACELRTGSAFRFSDEKGGGWRHGEMVDSDVEVSLAVAASAAYPLLLPALDREWLFRKHGTDTKHRVVLTDGGVYDNLGVSVLEPGRDATYSLHTFKCDHLIVCSAGHGQESGTRLPIGMVERVGAAFETIHRRVQDSTMQRLHSLKRTEAIKGFALPYLGQQDSRLPYKPSNLVSRSSVIEYPTDFAPMKKDWIDTLSLRGEQLTRMLVPYYMPNL